MSTPVHFSMPPHANRRNQPPADGNPPDGDQPLANNLPVNNLPVNNPTIALIRTKEYTAVNRLPERNHLNRQQLVRLERAHEPHLYQLRYHWLHRWHNSSDSP